MKWTDYEYRTASLKFSRRKSHKRERLKTLESTQLLDPKARKRLNVRLTKGAWSTSGGRRLRSSADVASEEPKKWLRLTIVGHCVLHRKNRKRGNYQLTANIVLFARSFEAVAVFARQSMTLLSGNIQSGNTGFSTVMKAFQCLCHKITCVWLVCTWR